MWRSILILWLYQALAYCSEDEHELSEVEDLYRIEGKVAIEGAKIEDWGHHTRILVNGGEYAGFVRSDGTFVVSNIPSGSHIVEVYSPNYVFESARVEISSKSKGKMRARKVDNVQPSKVEAIPYPLRFKAKDRAGYFEKREQWRITDALANPMVIWSLKLNFLVQHFELSGRC